MTLIRNAEIERKIQSFPYYAPYDIAVEKEQIALRMIFILNIDIEEVKIATQMQRNMLDRLAYLFKNYLEQNVITEKYSDLELQKNYTSKKISKTIESFQYLAPSEIATIHMYFIENKSIMDISKATHLSKEKIKELCLALLQEIESH